MENIYFTGLIEDPRSDAEKALDFKHEELVGSSLPSAPFDSKKILVDPYPSEDQQQVGSCVPHGIGKALAIERSKDTDEGYQRLSWTAAYRLRFNYPSAGCWPQNIFEVYRVTGAPLFTTLPDPQTEQEASDVVVSSLMKVEAAIFKGLAYVQFAIPNDIDTLASVAEQGKGVPITIYSTYAEWAQEYPQVTNSSLKSTDAAAVVNHCICILPNSGFIENGIKYVAVADSAHFGGRVLRYLSENFIAARVMGGGYWVAPAVLGSGSLPVHIFTKILKSGMTDPEVVWLQKLLIAEGFLPADCASGFFGGMTLSALHAFQNKYAADILVPLKLDAPTDMFGSMSIAKANALCAPKV